MTILWASASLTYTAQSGSYIHNRFNVNYYLPYTPTLAMGLGKYSRWLTSRIVKSCAITASKSVLSSS